MRTATALLLFVILGAIAGACASSRDSGGWGGNTADGGPPPSGAGDDAANLVGDDGSVASGTLLIAPAAQTINVVYGQHSPTITYTATANGASVPATFAIDRGEIASIDAASGVMTPTGSVGGVAHVSATYRGQHASTTVTVHIDLFDNGGTMVGDAGVGGKGGVGGEGPGGPVGAGTQAVLQGQPASDSGLTWLYPYDKTVWPRSLLAPLLQWNAPRNYDAIFIELKENAFDYKGYFANTATPFVHHPIPQAAWDALTFSNGGEDVTVTIVFSSGGVAYGPLTETWKIALGDLKGTVYYQSYGTTLAKNSCCGPNNTPFGAATLAIKHGATSPLLVTSATECQVCHSVSADGSTLVTQQNDPTYDYSPSYVYNLKNGYSSSPMNPNPGPPDGRYELGALSPDGTFLLSDGADLNGISFAGDSQLFNVPDGTPRPSTGIPVGLRAGSPAFSPDGKHVAFNYFAGPAGDKVSLAMMDFDPATSTFSNLQVLFTRPAFGATGHFQFADWPSFLPTSSGIVFEFQLQDDDNNDWGYTRMSQTGVPAQGELWWIDVASKTAARLDNLNGHGYLPTMVGTNHTDDTILNYEPTMNVIASGGYAWVVFTSRRLYGNVASSDPYASDPGQYDLRANPPTKKLWVAAIDLNPTPGQDPSHPAFYLPGQELIAGNSRGYWVVDPCHPNGQACQTGDECCGGYCRTVDGGSVCTDQPGTCSAEYDKCTQSNDCCDPTMTCIGGRCAAPVAQ
jgi:hypothetical protein